MIVVCDSSVLITLSDINQLHLLDDMFGGVLISTNVYDEVVELGAGRAGEEEVRNAPFISVVDLKDPDQTALYMHPLSESDASLIVLAKEQNANLILTRDNDLRKRAIREQLTAMTIFTLFVEAKTRGYIPAVRPLLDEMRNRGILIREGVYQETLRQAGELEDDQD